MKNSEESKKITSSDCVKAICKVLYFQGKRGDELNPNNWKRRSKTGSGTIERTFENIVTGRKILVSETDGQICKLSDVTDYTKEANKNTELEGLELLYINNDDGVSLCVLSVTRDGKLVNNMDKTEIRKMTTMGEEEDFGVIWTNTDFACGGGKNAQAEKKIEKTLMDMGLEEESEGVFSASEDKIEGIIFKLESMGVVVYRNIHNKVKTTDHGDTTKTFKETSVDEDLTKDFPYVYKFEFATVYSKCKLAKWEFKDKTEEIEDSNYEQSGISKSTRIGTVNAGEDEIETIMVFTKDSVFYSNDGDMTNDGVSYFEIGKNTHFCPAQEPIDLMEGFGDFGVEEKRKLKNQIKKYGLDHLLLSM